MSKKQDNSTKTALERGQSIKPFWKAFALKVLQPVKGSDGNLMFEATIHGKNQKSAMDTLRDQINGSGWVVVPA
jgi:hypothetical protein